MNRKFEAWGIRLELAGLIVLLAATFWQANFSGWWDNQSPEWQYWIQEEVNFASLSALSDIAILAEIEDKEERKKKAYEVNHNATAAIVKAIDMREKRNAALEGQASLFSKITLILMSLGALLIIFGKYMVLKAVNIRTKKC